MKKQVTTWMETALCEKLRRIAALEQRTLSGQIRILVRRVLEQYEQTHGSLPRLSQSKTRMRGIVLWISYSALPNSNASATGMITGSLWKAASRKPPFLRGIRKIYSPLFLPYKKFATLLGFLWLNSLPNPKNSPT